MSTELRRAGSLKSPDDPADLIFERLARGGSMPCAGTYISVIPEVYDMRAESCDARDQGRRGTCAAFAATGIKEIQERRDCGFTGFMSPEFIYYHRDNKPAHGMYGRNVLQILQRIGSVPESEYPYLGDESAAEPAADLYELAANFKIGNYARVQTADGMKRALLEMGPGLLLLPLYKRRPEFWRPEDEDDKCEEGGHAVAVVGYNADGFILRNSWGDSYGDRGYVTLPYADWPCVWECWTAVDEKTIIPPQNIQGGRNKGKKKKPLHQSTKCGGKCIIA